MITAGIFEAKQRLSALVEAVEAGEDVRITRHGREVARLVPAPPAKPVPTSGDEVSEGLRTLRELRARVRPGPGWKALRDEGRKY